MFLDSVEIVNFRRYYGRNDFELDFTDEKNISIVVADNNSGKSSLVNALSWALYGDELHDSKERSEPLCNVVVLDEAEKKDNNPTAKVEVNIQFYNIADDGEREYYKINRGLTFYKFGNSDWTPDSSHEIIFEDNLAQIFKDSAAQAKINEIIPPYMFKYFFFNGPSMSKYFEYDGEDTFNLKDSIDNISQLGLIKTVYKQLEGTSKKLDKDFKENKDTDEDELIINLNDKKDKRREERRKRDDYKNKRDDAYREKLKYENKLKKIKATKIKKLINEREEYKKTKKDLLSKIQVNKESYEKLVLELFPICAIFEPLSESYVIMENSIEKNAIPKDVKEQILKIIEDEGKCICGLDLNTHPECIEDVKNKLKVESDVNSLYRDEYKYIGNVLKKLRNLPKIEELKSSINDDENHLNLINAQLEDISNQLLDSDEEKVKQFENSLNKFINLEEKYSKRYDASLIRINNLDTEISELQGKVDGIEYINQKLSKIKSKMDFCNELIDKMDDLENGVRTRIRNKVNEKTKDQFVNLKYDEYSDIYIDDLYDVTIVENEGRTVKPADVSDGTENLLALSFIMALHSIKGIDFPLIIDAPFEKLDRTSRVDFVNSLHDFTKDKQVIFLFTDSQYTDEVRSHILKIVLDEFKLIKTAPKKTVIKHVV